MKASVILTLPVLALAAATPAKIEERQANLSCLRNIEGLTDCINPGNIIGNPFALLTIIGCVTDGTLPATVLGLVTDCLRL